MLPDIAFEAAFLRAALLLGVINEREVPAWAESLLLVQDEAHGFLSDVAMAPVELTAMREALQPMAATAGPAAVLTAIVTFLARDRASLSLNVHDAVRVFTLLRTEFRIPPDGTLSAKQFEDRLMLAEGGVKGAVAPTREELDDWLSSVRRPSVRRLSFTSSDEATAFLGVLVHEVERDVTSLENDPANNAKAWVMPFEIAAPVTLAVNDPAWRIAVREFSPLPLAGRIPYAAAPDYAVLVLHGMTRVAPVNAIAWEEL